MDVQITLCKTLTLIAGFSSRKWVVRGFVPMKMILASLAVLTACSGSPLDPGAGSSAGTGTSTLSVDGNARARANIANAKRSTDFTTDVSVRVTLNGAPVTTGTVTIRSSKLSVPLTFHADQNGGTWEGTAAGYDEVYQLDVVSGTDTVEGVIVDGPDIHDFTAPEAGATLDSTLANMMTWDRIAAADIATLRVGELDRITIEDSGTFSIPPGSLKAEKDQARPNTLLLERTNHVVPAGAVPGSDFAVSVENELDVIAAPNPAL